MIVLAPIRLTQGEAATLIQTYRVNGIGKDWTGYSGTWSIAQHGTQICSGTVTLDTDGDMSSSFSVAQIDALSVPDQYVGRTLADTYFQITITGAETYQFRAAVTVFRGLNYGATTVDSTSLLDDDGDTLLAE